MVLNKCTINNYSAKYLTFELDFPKYPISMKFVIVTLWLSFAVFSIKAQNYDSIYHANRITNIQNGTWAFPNGLIVPQDTVKLFSHGGAPGSFAYKNGAVYFNNGIKWMSIGGASYSSSGYVGQYANSFYLDTTLKKAATQTMLSDSVSGTVKYRDSAEYVTPTRLTDTAKSIRTAIPSISGLATTVALNDTAINVRSYGSTNLADTAIVLRGLIPSLTGYATTVALNDTAINVRSYTGTNLIDTAAVLRTYSQTNLVDTAAALRTTINTKGSGTVTSIAATGGTGITVTGSPITSSGVMTVTATGSITAGTGISVGGSFPTYTVTNSSPGFSNPMTTLGDIIYGGSSGTPTKLSGNTTTGLQFLGQTGNGTNSAAPTWQTVPVSGYVVYYFQPSAASVGGYYRQISTPYGTNTVLPTQTVTASNQVLYNFITDVGVPNKTYLPEGLYQINGHIAQTAGTQSCYFYAEIWETNSSGVDVALIATTGTSSVLNNTYADLFVSYQLTSPYILASTGSRIDVRIRASTTGGGSNPKVSISVGGSTDSRVSLPSNIVDATNFIPYSGATNNVSLGTYSLTAANISGTTSGVNTGDQSIGLAGGTGISIGGSPLTGSGTMTVTATGGLTAGTGITLSGSFPTYTVTNSSPSSGGTVTSVGLVAGTGMSVTGSSPITSSGTYTVVNTSPASGVTITAGSNISVTSSAPAFTVTSTPPGSSTQMTYNNGGSWAASSNVLIGSADQNMLIGTSIYTTAVTAPSSGSVKVYGSSINGQDELWGNNSLGVDLPFETFLGNHQWGLFTTNGTAIQTQGFYVSAITPSGTAAFNLRTYDATNLAPNLMYYKLTGSASVNNQVELYFGYTGRDALIGNAAYGAGSKLVIDCVLPAYVSTQRFFAGYSSTFGQMSTTTDPSTVLNIIGVGKDVADATLFFMFNNGSGTATKVNTGITPTANDEYIITVTLPSNTTSSTVTIERRTKTAVTKNSATNSAKIPAAGTLMYWHAYSNCGTAGTPAPVIGIKQVWEEIYN